MSSNEIFRRLKGGVLSHIFFDKESDFQALLFPKHHLIKTGPEHLHRINLKVLLLTKIKE